MIRLWLVLVAFVLALAVAANAATPLVSICELHVQSHSGSGTLVAVHGDRALVLTARHVAVRLNEPVRVSWPWAGNQVRPGRVCAIVSGEGYDTDLALVHTYKPTGVPVIPVASFSASQGPWLAAGFRRGEMRYQPVGAAELFDNGLVKVHAPLIGGMSGGPLFDPLGRVVAVNVATNKRSGYCANGRHLQELLQRFGKRGTYEKQE